VIQLSKSRATAGRGTYLQLSPVYPRISRISTRLFHEGWLGLGLRTYNRQMPIGDLDQPLFAQTGKDTAHVDSRHPSRIG
jgi:hypothetical protein